MNVATVGTGFITDWFLNAVQQMEGVTCSAMFSRNTKNAEKLAQTYKVPRIYTNYEEMLNQSDIDFIYVASPNSLHFQYSIDALKAGKHVICEKPFTSTSKEFALLSRYAKDHHLFLFEAIVTAHMPNYKTLKENLHKLGQIRVVQCNFSQYSSRYDKFLQGEVPNVFNPDFSGGALADINIYNLHFVMGLFGKPNEVHYYPNKHQNGIDTSGVVIMEYDGYQAVCVGCKDTKSHCLAQIQGEKGFIRVDSETSKCSDITLHVDDNVIQLSQSQNDVALFHELKDFKDIYDRKDYKACYEELAYSKMVMEVFEKARHNGGIHYKADDIEPNI